MEWIIIILLIFGLVVTVSLQTLNRKHDGNIVIREDEDGKTIFSLELDVDPDEIKKMNVVVFKVVKGVAD